MTERQSRFPVPVRLRMTADMAAGVEAAARQERRTISAWIRNLIADRLGIDE